MNPFQGTLAKVIEFNGVGLHNGKLISLSIHPAGPNYGIRFKRTDIENSKEILAHLDNIISTTLCTTIGKKNQEISTIEHLMAAFSGLGIDNALVCINSNEIPILDGSSAPFVDKLNEIGVQRQEVKRRVIRLSQPLEVRCKDQFMRYEPCFKGNDSCLQVNYTIDFSCSKAIGKQSLSIALTSKAFMSLCEARTFCHINEVNGMRKQGLAMGGSLDNAVVVDDEKVINNDGLRYSDEFVRHKVLDCIGDLALLGGQLLGRITVHKGGHSLHAQFVKKISEVLTKTKSDYVTSPNSPLELLQVNV
tara:strand:+ start:717 stop:1631 length:915 start_codon:yes stop_codon:yes gene_type:complete